MATVENVGRLQSLLRALAGKYPDTSVIVGYTQAYSLFVHEDLTAHHPVGQAKYLEQPARELKDELGGIITKAVKGGVPLNKALVMAGLRLQAESQRLVPVDTGALKGSAFTREEVK